MTAKATPPDWTQVRLTYVNGTESYAALAKRMKLSESAVEKRGERESWNEERRRLAEQARATAQAKLSEQRAAELEKFNEDDLRVAKAIRAQVALTIKAAQDAKHPMDPKELRAVAGALEAAQRVGRLALGAETDSSIVRTQELPAGVDEFV